MRGEVGRRRLRPGSPWLVTGLVVASFVAYAPTLRTPLFGDDYVWVQSVAGSGPRVAWLVDLVGGPLRPLLLASVSVDHALGGLDPLGYHVTNVLLHALSAWLVALIADTLLAGADRAWL